MYEQFYKIFRLRVIRDKTLVAIFKEWNEFLFGFYEKRVKEDS